MYTKLVVQLLFWTLSSIALADPLALPTSSAPIVQSTACGLIVKSCNSTFTAKQAYDCLISVPFNPAVASRFIEYYNDTIQFHTTLSYLKSPPPGYQQPATDILKGLQDIQHGIDGGLFPNQYAFEATLQSLIQSAHDVHFQLDAGILAAFDFESPYSIVSLSEDGIQDPKIYLTADVFLTRDLKSTFKPSAVKSINGQDVTQFLSQFAAANSFGNLEPNADWNSLMASQAAYIQNQYSVFETSIELYPGETITITFENGTQLDPLPWTAVYNSMGPTGPLATGGDFYNVFVLGLYPVSFDPNAPNPCDHTNATTNTSTASEASIATRTATSWPGSAYPTTADVFQPNLYPDGGGFVTGYFLKDTSTAVLSIPTFDMSGNDTQTFSDTVGKFLSGSHAAGMQRILIDLQQNSGGDSLLAVDTFKHFFPSRDPFRGSRLRVHPVADVLGNTFTAYFESSKSPNSSVYGAVAASEWVATDRLNAATGQNFTSWAEFFGPHEYNSDLFTTVQRENISSSTFDYSALGIDIYGVTYPASLPQQFDPEDIIILTDSLCSSACADFVEMMHHEAGVRTVVAGGSPKPGPMQTASGSRGAQLYTADLIDNDISAAEYLNTSTNKLLPDRSVDTLITFLGINLRDQIRQDQPDIPVQFLYDAADCRIFYTTETWLNYTSLWTYAVNAIFSNPALCVPQSTGYASKQGTDPPSSPPSPSNNKAFNASALTAKFTTEFTGLELDSFTTVARGKARTVQQTCNNHGNDCSNGYCRLDLKTPGTKGTYQGRTYTFRDGTCPTNPAGNGGDLKDLVTDSDQPREKHGKRSTDKLAGRLE